jgi:hypothetical protein
VEPGSVGARLAREEVATFNIDVGRPREFTGKPRSYGGLLKTIDSKRR